MNTPTTPPLITSPDQIDHSEMVARLAKDGAQILSELTKEKCHLWHMATGASGEAGELLDAVKKHVAYNREIDRENVIEVLGDLEFYAEGIRQAVGVTREEVLLANKTKLFKRYAGFNYTNQAAQERADKGGAQ